MTVSTHQHLMAGFGHYRANISVSKPVYITRDIIKTYRAATSDIMLFL